MARDLRTTRAADRLGRFGEGLVAYLLMRKGYEIAFIDGIGADLIASKGGKRFAISVKTRLFREDSQESRMRVIEETHLGKLNVFAGRYGLQPLFASVVSLAREGTIQSFIMPIAFIKQLPQVQHGYTLRFPKRADVARLAREDSLFSAHFHEKEIRDGDFGLDEMGSWFPKTESRQLGKTRSNSGRSEESSIGMQVTNYRESQPYNSVKTYERANRSK